MRYSMLLLSSLHRYRTTDVRTCNRRIYLVGTVAGLRDISTS